MQQHLCTYCASWVKLLGGESRAWRTQEFGKELGMPVVLSNITERRDPYFREIYSELLSSLRSNGILRGAATTARFFPGSSAVAGISHVGVQGSVLCLALFAARLDP